MHCHKDMQFAISSFSKTKIITPVRNNIFLYYYESSIWSPKWSICPCSMTGEVHNSGKKGATWNL